MFKRLVVMISSTADLQAERDAIEATLATLETDGSRFETWPSAPTDPLATCLAKVDECDALVLLLGSRYGSIDSESGLSITHLEYRHAKRHKKPVFAFVLANLSRDEQQQAFVTEVEAAIFRCPVVKSADELASQVRAAILGEFTRCFRTVHARPSEKLETLDRTAELRLPDDLDSVLAILRGAIEAHHDRIVHYLAEECERRYPDEPEILNLLYVAEVNLAMDRQPVDRERVKRAVTFWGLIAEEQPVDRSVFKYNQANALHALGHLKEAKKFYEDSLAVDPNYAECWKNLGNVLYDLGEPKDAYACFDKALQIDPNLQEAIFSSATRAMEEEDYAKAAAILDRIDPEGYADLDRLSALYYTRALTYSSIGRYADALRSAESCVALAGEHEWAWHAAARAYALARRTDDQFIPATASFFRRFVVAVPFSAEGWAELGFSLWALADTDRDDDPSVRGEAEDAFRRAVELGIEDDGLIYDRLAHLAQEKGETARAEECFRLAAAKSSDPFSACLADLLIEQGRFDEGGKVLTELSRLRANDAVVLNRLAHCLSQTGRHREAASTYRRAVEIDPTDANSWYNLGGMLWNLGESAEASSVWSRALQDFPEHPLAERARAVLVMSRLIHSR